MSIEDVLENFIKEDRKWKAEFSEKDAKRAEEDRKWKSEQKLERKELLAAVKKIDIIFESIVRSIKKERLW